MGSRNAKSEKQSNTWKLLEARYPLFLDKNQGNKKLPQMLREVGLRVECHSEHFPDEKVIPDPEWIQLCGLKGWIVVTGDKAIEHDPINRQAVIDSKAKVVMLEENNSRAIEWASAITVSRKELLRIVDEKPGPFIVSLRKESAQLVVNFRSPIVT